MTIIDDLKVRYKKEVAYLDYLVSDKLDETTSFVRTIKERKQAVINSANTLTRLDSKNPVTPDFTKVDIVIGNIVSATVSCKEI